MKFDLTSDTHVDFWIGIHLSPKKQEKNMHLLIKSLLPENKSDILVIAGDIGHYNTQNAMFFKVLREYYNAVLWVHGNHDLYMVSNSVKKAFNFNSFERLQNMIDLSSKIDGVHYLNGDVFEFDGTKFGGCGMWYNYDYAKEVWNMTDEGSEALWNRVLNDSNLIRTVHPITGMVSQINNLEYYAEQRQILDSVYPMCDVIVSHITPTWEKLYEKWKVPSTTFYAFDGRDALKNLNDQNIWVHGHTHDNYFYQAEGGCTIVCNPLGYPMEYPGGKVTERAKFLTIDSENIKSYEDLFKEIE
jgi:predicted phosphodiesterase